MPHRITELQATYLKLAVEEGLGPAAIARRLSNEEDRRLKTFSQSIGRALIDIRNNFAVYTNEEAYAIAVAEGLIAPPQPPAQ